MAATGWTYYCPFNPDPAIALRQLREDVFARRAYSLPADLLQSASDQALNEIAPPVDELKKMLNFAKAIDDAMAELGADTEESARQNKKTEAFINKMEKDGYAAAARGVTGSQASQDPANIDEALEIAAEAGTHSILDIDKIADAPEFGAATALGESELLELFGTTEPTIEMAQTAEKDGKLCLLRGGWQAVYFPVYSNRQPQQYVFAGNSGD